MTNGKVELIAGTVMIVPSGSTPGVEHQVRLSKNGRIYCDCRGFAWRSHCSHVAEFLKQSPLAKTLVKASILLRIEGLKVVLAKLDE